MFPITSKSFVKYPMNILVALFLVFFFCNNDQTNKIRFRFFIKSRRLHTFYRQYLLDNIQWFFLLGAKIENRKKEFCVFSENQLDETKLTVTCGQSFLFERVMMGKKLNYIVVTTPSEDAHSQSKTVEV